MSVYECIATSAKRARSLLSEHGFPYSDNLPLLRSQYTYPDKKKYGIEVPVMNSFAILKKTIELLNKEGINCIRFNETKGAFLLCDNEISEMLALCAESKHGILFSIGPRPEYDRKAAFYQTEFGLEQGRRLNNNDAIAYAVEDVLRLADLGCKGVLVYDLGVLKILSQFKMSGVLPNDFLLKVSTHCMVTNSVTAQVYAENGASSITTPHDIDFPVLQEMRRTLKDSVILDVPVDTYKTKGGFIRFYEVADIIEIASPVMLKVGAGAQGHPYDPVNNIIIEERVKRIIIVLEHLSRAGITMDRVDQTSNYLGCPSVYQSAALSASV